jgi:hypothetical protein
MGGSGGLETFDDDDFDGFDNLQHPSEILPDEAACTGAGRGHGLGAGREGLYERTTSHTYRRGYQEA